MKRTSFLAQLEFIYVFALRCEGYQVGNASPFQLLILEYIDLFFDKSDVLADLEAYFKLINGKEEVNNIKIWFRDRVGQAEEMEGEPKTLTNENGSPIVGSHLNQSSADEF